MAVYFVTGKLGGGKSLVSVSRIKIALLNGAPIATNIDLNLQYLVGRNDKKSRVFRMPDKPSVADLHAIGVSNKSYDESKNGLLVLDECGTWFNSRSWNDKSRQHVINWMLHARKLGWDIIFIVQDISIVDKQARLALGEHVVYCRRLDRLTIPFVGRLYKLFTGSRLPLPKVHMGIVKYGDSQNAMTVDRWSLVGITLYSSYDTKQAFSDNYEHGVYTVLPPYYTIGRYSIPYTVKNIMRLTKIYWRRFSRPVVFIAGILVAVAASIYVRPLELKKVESSNVQVKEVIDLKAYFEGYKITSFSNFPNQPVKFTLTSKDKSHIYSEKLTALGLEFNALSRCHIQITQGAKNETLTCS